jgi:hypothetical protein
MAGIISIVGLLAIFITIGVLATNVTKIPDHDLSGVLVALAFGGLGGIALIDFLIFRTISAAKTSRKKTRDNKTATPGRVQIPMKKAELPPPSVESFTSVVEHTTHRLPDYEGPQPVHKEPIHHTICNVRQTSVCRYSSCAKLCRRRPQTEVCRTSCV